MTGRTRRTCPASWGGVVSEVVAGSAPPPTHVNAMPRCSMTLKRDVSGKGSLTAAGDGGTGGALGGAPLPSHPTQSQRRSRSPIP